MDKDKFKLFDFGICVCDRKKNRQHFLSPDINQKDIRKMSMASEPC